MIYAIVNQSYHFCVTPGTRCHLTTTTHVIWVTQSDAEPAALVTEIIMTHIRNSRRQVLSRKNWYALETATKKWYAANTASVLQRELSGGFLNKWFIGQEVGRVTRLEQAFIQLIQDNEFVFIIILPRDPRHFVWQSDRLSWFQSPLETWLIAPDVATVLKRTNSRSSIVIQSVRC